MTRRIVAILGPTGANLGAGMSTGTISKAPISGVGPTVDRAIMQNWPLCLAVDATTIYWINEGGGSIQKVSKQ